MGKYSGDVVRDEGMDEMADEDEPVSEAKSPATRSTGLGPRAMPCDIKESAGLGEDEEEDAAGSGGGSKPAAAALSIVAAKADGSSEARLGMGKKPGSSPPDCSEKLGAPPVAVA